jgi:RsiW-degrading membrane proteinase PrsW (M82 family)
VITAPPGIVLAAVVAVAISAALYGGLLRSMALGRRGLLLAAGLAVPLSTVVNLGLKAPVGDALAAGADRPPELRPGQPWWLLLGLYLLAPVFEEPIKLLPLLVPRVRHGLRAPNGPLWTGMALGVGFGCGEALYLGGRIALSGVDDGVPWYAFTGFIGERTVVCFVHGVMTAVFLTLASRGGARWAGRGFLAAAALHALVNVGPLLVALRLLPSVVASMLLLLTVVGLGWLFERLRRQARAAPGAAPRSPTVVLYGPGAGDSDAGANKS